MPVSKSAEKALRKDQRREAVNRLIRKKIKKALKETRTKPSADNLKRTASILDRAAKKRVIHPKKASRLKSRLAKLNQKSS